MACYYDVKGKTIVLFWKHAELNIGWRSTWQDLVVLNSYLGIFQVLGFSLYLDISQVSSKWIYLHFFLSLQPHFQFAVPRFCFCLFSWPPCRCGAQGFTPSVWTTMLPSIVPPGPTSLCSAATAREVTRYITLLAPFSHAVLHLSPASQPLAARREMRYDSPEMSRRRRLAAGRKIALWSLVVKINICRVWMAF